MMIEKREDRGDDNAKSSGASIFVCAPDPTNLAYSPTQRPPTLIRMSGGII